MAELHSTATIISPSVQQKMTTGPGAISNISFSPPVSSGASNSYNIFRDKAAGYFPSYSDYFDDVDNFLGKYIKYNNDMYNRAVDYDMMMSNTAIRRQMEDLKKAGINPILAGRLGGAQYKGVSAPYITINPSSALGALMDYAGSQMNYDARMKEIASREKISENELKQEAELAEKYIEGQLKSARISANAIIEAAKVNGMNNKDIQEMKGQIDVITQDMYDKTWKEINENNLKTEKEVSNNRNIVDIVSAGIRGIGSVVSGMIIASKFKGKGDGFFGGNSTSSYSREEYNNWVEKNILPKYGFEAGAFAMPLIPSMLPIW